MDEFSLAGETALVTGAGSGIGRAIAIGLARAGADVALFGRNRDGAGLAETAAAIVATGRRALVVPGDVTSAADLAGAIDRIEAELGPLTLAVNNAGVGAGTAAEEITADEWNRVVETNYTGVFLCCQAEARVMLPRRRGAIVNIASISASIANRGLLQVHYNSSKAAVVHLTKSLAAEWVDRGLRLNVLSPGYTLTPMNRRPEVADHVRRFADETPMGRLADVDEMVGPAVFLLSRAASFVTGHDLVVDGGFTLW